MKKLITVLIVTMLVSLSAFAQKYKVNTSGKVTAPNGQTQNSKPQNLYNNYYGQQYVATRQAAAGNIGTVEIVMDYSGSMYSWIEAAKSYMAGIISQLPPTIKTGFRVFGHDGGNNPYNPIMGKVKEVVKKKDGSYKVKSGTESYLGKITGSCSATMQVTPIASDNAAALSSGMRSVQLGGSTPLTLSLEQAVKYDFKGMDTTSPKKIILITDGGENCGGDPCAFARALMKQRKDIVIDVVLVSSSSNALRCLATETGGHLYNPVDIGSFINVITDSIQNPAPDTHVYVETQPQNEQYYEYVKD